jgi:hypothetical protein
METGVEQIQYTVNEKSQIVRLKRHQKSAQSERNGGYFEQGSGIRVCGQYAGLTRFPAPVW